MATTIGRVDFIVDLDGDKIPAKARALGKQIAAAGKQSGKDFSENFDNEFEKGLSDIGKKASAAMREAGRLGAEDFDDEVEKTLKSRQGRISSLLADTLVDKDALAKAFGQFDSSAEALDHFERELKQVGGSVDKYSDTLLEAAEADDVARKAQAEHARESKKLAGEIEKVNVEIDRLNRMAGDTEAIRKATGAHKDYASTAATMREEMRKLAAQGDVSVLAYQRYSDQLEKTVETLKKQDAAETAATQKQDDRRRSLEKLDKIQAEIARNMGTIGAYKQYVKDAGDAEVANTRLAASFERLRDAGGSEKAVADLENRIKSYNATIDGSKSKTKTWAEALSNPLDGVMGAWRRMDGTVKLVIASIIGAGDQVAVLGSALGAGLVAVGSGLASLVVGVAAGIGVFSRLFEPFEDAPATLRPVIGQFGSLKDAVGELNDEVAQAAFDEMDGTFADLTGTINALSPALSRVGRTLGVLIDDFSEGVKPGTEGFDLLRQTIDDANPALDSLGRTVGTFGLALLRSFGEAQPLVEDMLGWLDKLATSFDDFSKSTEFNTWVRNAQDVWSAFSGTLDAVSLALHDLVTPEAVERTTALLDNITRLAPGLSDLLDAAGTLDVFGILAKIAADLAEQFEKVAPAAKAVAQVLNDVFMAVPPEAWAGLAIAIGAVTTAIIGLKVASAIGAGLSFLGDKLTALSTSFDRVSTKATKTKGILSKLGGGKALGIGAAAVAATVAFDLLGNAIEEGVPKMDDLAEAAADSSNALALLRTASERSGIEKAFWGDYNDSLKDLPKLLSDAENAAAGFGGETLNLSFNQQGALDSLERLGEGIATLAEDDLPGAQAAFRSIVEQFNLTDEEAAILLSRMGPLEGVFKDVAEATGQAATAQGILVSAMGDTTPTIDENIAALGKLQTASGIVVDSINDVSDAIRGFGDTSISAQEAAIDYQQALDDVTESVKENGTEWDVSTEAGRKNQKAVLDLVQGTKDLSAATLDNTGSQEQANKVINDGRTKLIEQLAQFGITGQAAEDYADSVGLVTTEQGKATAKADAQHRSLQNVLEQFGLTSEEADAYATKLEEVPADVDTFIKMLGTNTAITDANSVKAALDAIQAQKDIWITVHHTRIESIITRSNNPANAGQPGTFASGGIADKATLGIFGEAGREAFVPLERPLSQVDPSVRALAAFAQGKLTPDMIPGFSQLNGGGSTAAGPGRVVNVQPGAIVIQGDRAPETTATNVVNRLAQRVAG
jgi:hypothetical protein